MRLCRIASVGVSLPGRHPWRRGSLARAVEAGRDCLRRSRLRRGDVGVLAYAGVTRDFHLCEPAFAAYVQRRLGINAEFQGRPTFSFDLLNGGCGMLDAAQVVGTLLQQGEGRAGLVIAAEGNRDWLARGDRAGPDSGAALLLDLAPHPGVGFGSFAFRTHPEHAELCTTVVSLAEPRGRLRLQRAAGLEDRWLELAGEVVDEVLAEEGVDRDGIERVVAAPATSAFLARLADAIAVPRERIAAAAPWPDTLSTSLFLAWQRSLAARPPAAGSTGLLLACGSGLTVAAATYRF